jgi:hypothetical protein
MTTPPISRNADGQEGQPGEPVVVRTKEVLFERPRSAMAPRRVFGPGFLARLREKQTLSWFLTAFLALGLWLLGVGLVGLTGLETLPEGRKSVVGALAWGSLFSFGSLWMFRLALAQAETERRARGGDLPWTWDHPWRPEWMAPEQQPWSGLILSRLAVLGLVAVVNVIDWEKGCGPRGIVLGVDALGLVLLYDSVRKLVQWIRFRHPIVTWVSLPAFLGESLEGRLSFARPVRPSEPPQLTLRCVREEVERNGGTEQRRVFRIYSQTQTLPLGGEPVDYLDFAFDLPDPVSSLATELHAKEPVYWQLLVKVPVAGPDLEARFLAPVYRKMTAKKKNG